MIAAGFVRLYATGAVGVGVVLDTTATLNYLQRPHRPLIIQNAVCACVLNKKKNGRFYLNVFAICGAAVPFRVAAGYHPRGFYIFN